MCFRRNFRLAALLAAVLPVAGQASTVLTSGTFTTIGGGGQTGAAAATTCMIMSDGSSWSGGAAGVQGAASTNVYGLHPLAANIVFKFDIGAFVDSLNATYGVGNWAVENITLEFQYTLYANNPRFGGGAGTFDVFWVENDDWVQGANNPVYATSAAGLEAWAGRQALLAEIAYPWTTPNYTGTVEDLSAWTTDKQGDRQARSVLDLGTTGGLLEPITSASASGDTQLSLYLMATSDSLGLTIFTGGGGEQGILPTLSFDVVAVPEPGSAGPAVVAGLLFAAVRRRRK